MAFLTTLVLSLLLPQDTPSVCLLALAQGKALFQQWSVWWSEFGNYRGWKSGALYDAHGDVMCLPLESSTRNGWRELRCTIWLAVPCFPCLACLLCFLHAGQPCPLPAPVITSISHLSCFGVFANERFVEPCKLRRIVIHVQDFHRHGDTAHLRGIVWKEKGSCKERQLVAREKKWLPALQKS